MRAKELREYARRGIEYCSSSFTTPDDDWVPVVFVDDLREPDVPYVFSLEHCMDERVMPELWSHVIPGIMHHVDAHVAVLVLSMWAVSDDDEECACSSPHRYEILTLTTVTQGGVETEKARVLRSKKSPPRLDAWVEAKPIEEFVPLSDFLRRLHADRV